MQPEQAEAAGPHAALAAAAFHLIPNRQAQQPAAINVAVECVTHNAGVDITGHNRYPLHKTQARIHFIQRVNITAHNVGKEGCGRIAGVTMISVITGITGPAQAVSQGLGRVCNTCIPAQEVGIVNIQPGTINRARWSIS